MPPVNPELVVPSLGTETLAGLDEEAADVT